MSNANDNAGAFYELGPAESACEACGGPNIIWFAPNDLWNAYAGNYCILCPICFARRAESGGLRPTAWVLRPEEVSDMPTESDRSAMDSAAGFYPASGGSIPPGRASHE